MDKSVTEKLKDCGFPIVTDNITAIVFPTENATQQRKRQTLITHSNSIWDRIKYTNMPTPLMEEAFKTFDITKSALYEGDE